MTTTLPVSRIQDKPFKEQWFRSSEGLLAGVCEGLGKRFGVDPWLVRVLWLVSVMALGTGLLLYVILAVCLPRQDRLAEAYDKRVLGVCSRISRATELDVGLVRTAAVHLGLGSLGATVVGYIVLHFVVSDESRSFPAARI